MKSLTQSVAFLFLIGLTTLTSTARSAEVISSYLVPLSGIQKMPEIADQFEVVEKTDLGFKVFVLKEKAALFLKLAPNAILIEQDIHSFLKTPSLERDDWLAGYHTLQTTYEFMYQIAKDYPDIARVINYGTTTQGRPLLALKLSDNVHFDEAEPRLMLTGATHGDELITVEVVLGLLDELIHGYSRDPRLTRMIDQTELYFIPVVSPDSYLAKSRYVDGKDPNREYPWPEQPERNPVSVIKHLMKFFEDRSFTGTMDFHSSGRLVMYPWAYTYSPIESFYEKILDGLTRSMAATNGYRPGQISKVIYVAKGSSADYYFWKNQSVAVAIEIGDTNVPSSAQIATYVNQNKESTWKYIEHFIQ